jgi:O-acetyl-ADP-ribose deacetylase (regulator of RNase III)
MLEYRNGDIFASGCQAICNAVNCVGVMGAGLAAAFKKRFPEMNKEYMEVCNNCDLEPGNLHFWTEPNGLIIINFPTKDHFIHPSKIEFITDGLATLKREIVDRKIASVAIPALGCGLGGLSWEDVRREIEKFAAELPDVQVVAYEPLT